MVFGLTCKEAKEEDMAILSIQKYYVYSDLCVRLVLLKICKVAWFFVCNEFQWHNFYMSSPQLSSVICASISALWASLDVWGHIVESL